MNETNALALEHVTKQYGSGSQTVTAIADVTLRVPTGQFLSVMGPSGSGKSTLLNLIAGLDAPTEGSVCVDGEDLSRMSDDARSDLRLQKIGFVFQSFNLFPHFTVAENVAWPLRFLGVRKSEARDRARSALSQVAIERGALDRKPAELSGGEQQRIAIARALVTEPRLVLADEPTGNLDSHTGQTILDLLQRLNAQRTLTIVLVTHSTFAATYGHRTVEMRDGRLARDVSAPRETGKVVPLNG